MRVLIALPNIENAKKIKNLLNQNGFDDILACDSGAQVISLANECEKGVMICGYRLKDMHYSEIFQYMPREFTMLLLATPPHFDNCFSSEILCLAMPLKSHSLVRTLRTLETSFSGRSRRKKRTIRTREQEKTLDRAKALLMEQNHMTEEQAHHYLQKLSMDSGTGLVEMAEMILTFDRY